MASNPPRGNLRTNPLYIDLEKEQVYTCGDHVRGSVRVDPSLRPRRINIEMEGYAVIHEASNRLRPEFFKFSKELFVSEGAHENLDIIRRGTAADGKVDLPFDFIFPEVAISPPPSDRKWQYPDDSVDHPRFQHGPGFVLPPSITGDTFSRNPNLLVGPKIVYALKVDMESNVPPPAAIQELTFIPPAPEYDLRLLQPHLELGTKLPGRHSRTKVIRTRKLLPDYKDASKLTKLKDKLIEKELFFGLETLTEIPFATFNILANPARVLVLKSIIPAIITVQHVSRSASVPLEPDLFLRRIQVKLLSSFHVFTPPVPNSKGPAKNNVEVIRDTLTLLDRKFETGNGLALFNGLSLTEVAMVELAHPKILPSFNSYGMALEHELQIDISGECASHEFGGMLCREKVQIVPAWRPHPSEAAVDAPALPGPEYQEVDPMAGQPLSAAIQRPHMLQRPPTYRDEAPVLQNGSHEFVPATVTTPASTPFPSTNPFRTEIAHRPQPPPYAA